MRKKVDEASTFLKKLANPNRLMIAFALVDAERSVGELETLLGIRQPGLSQQIAELREAGLIHGRKEAKQVYYSLADDRVTEMTAVLHRLFCDIEPVLRATPRKVVAEGPSQAAVFAKVARST
nr:metalloregulator ArsR/SmtB family transcription factor [Mesorhizobium sp. WSM4875]